MCVQERKNREPISPDICLLLLLILLSLCLALNVLNNSSVHGQTFSRHSWSRLIKMISLFGCGKNGERGLHSSYPWKLDLFNDIWRSQASHLLPGQAVSQSYIIIVPWLVEFYDFTTDLKNICSLLNPVNLLFSLLLPLVIPTTALREGALILLHLCFFFSKKQNSWVVRFTSPVFYLIPSCCIISWLWFLEYIIQRVDIKMREADVSVLGLQDFFFPEILWWMQRGLSWWDKSTAFCRSWFTAQQLR